MRDYIVQGSGFVVVLISTLFLGAWGIPPALLIWAAVAFVANRNLT